MSLHAVPETLARSTFGDLAAGDAVNVEAALRAGEPLGGHYVQGHVDAVGRIQSVEAEGDGLRVFVEAPPEVLRYLVEKGSVTVDGVSLTVAELSDDAFAVALVPYTLEATTLSELEPGQEVNLEVDVLAKYVERLLRPTEGYDPRMRMEVEYHAVRRDRGGAGGLPVGPVRDRGRRRRPRERGRPHDRGAVRHAGGDQLHGDARARPHLPLPDPRPLRRARRCAR